MEWLGTGRTPHGVRGLKWCAMLAKRSVAKSHPSRGAWIEIPKTERPEAPSVSRTPHGVRGLK